VVECQLPKLDVAGSSPVSRSKSLKFNSLQAIKNNPKPHTLFHYINDPHEAFLFGIRTTFRPSTESSSFLAAAAFCLRSVFVYSSSETPMPWPR
jgi:hypothetical protein